MFARQISVFPVFLGCLLCVAGCTDVSDPSRTDDINGETETGAMELQRAVDTFYNAWYDSDWDLYYSFFADDVVYIDSSGQHMSMDEQDAKAAEEAERIGNPLFDHPRENLAQTVRVSPSGEAGVAYWTFPFDYQTDNGVKTTIEYAESDVWWKIDGGWKVVLIHYHTLSKSEL